MDFIIWLTAIIILFVVSCRKGGAGAILVPIIVTFLSAFVGLIYGFIIAFILSLCVLCITAVMPKAGPSRKQMRAALAELRQCPACAEWVKREAKVCKHCHSKLEPPVVTIEAVPAQRVPAF